VNNAKFNTSSAPPSDGFDVTPDDDEDLPKVIRGFVVGLAGDVDVTFMSGNRVTLPSMVAGVMHPGYIKKIHAENTTATGIVGLTD